MKSIMKNLSCLLLILFSLSCSSNGVEPELSDEYMSLNVGDIRQYYDPGLDYYQQWEIKEKVKREDGVEVFTGQWSSSIDPAGIEDIKYYAIIDNYFVATELIKSTNSENPFYEQKLAKVNPVDGDKWIQTEGEPIKIYFVANYIGDYKTKAGEFQNVFGFTLDNMLTVYYAKYFGHIGSVFLQNENIKMDLSYSRINGREKGKYVDIKQNFGLTKKMKKLHITRLIF